MKDKGYIQIYTGCGKGKTTAAIGLAVRAAGNGLNVYMGQFMKKQKYGEIKCLEAIYNIRIDQFGTDVCLLTRDEVQELDIQNAKKYLKNSLDIMLSEKYDLIILDEVLVSIFFNLLSVEEVLDFCNQKPNFVELILTGRYAPQELIEKADLVTEAKEIKHYFNQGVMARDGIER